MRSPILTRAVNRLAIGHGARKSRFHNQLGTRLDLGGLLYLPHCLVTIVGLKLFGYRPQLPWLGYRAIKRLNKLIEPDWKVLEFGSGMSTIWLAKRCRKLVSIETDREWYRQVSPRLPNNVDYRLRELGEEYLLGDSEFDLIIVDGFNRDAVVTKALSKIRGGGYVFLDNSDMPDGQARARKILLARGTEIEIFNDVCPTMLTVNESVLARVTSQGRE